jgi:hypothetical protein
MEQLLIETVDVQTSVDQTSLQELSFAQLALVGGGEVCVTFD